MMIVPGRSKALFFTGICLWCGLVFPPIAHVLEARLIYHFLFQLPGLAFAGWLIIRALMQIFPRANPHWNQGGIATLLTALITILFWMIPRFLDESLTNPAMALAKYTSIPIFVGGALAFGWDYIPTFFKGFVKANFLSMLLFLSWLYEAAPVQLCHNYLIGDQLELSGHLFSIFLALCVIFSFKPLFGTSLPWPSRTGMNFLPRTIWRHQL